MFILSFWPNDPFLTLWSLRFVFLFRFHMNESFLELQYLFSFLLFIFKFESASKWLFYMIFIAFITGKLPLRLNAGVKNDLQCICYKPMFPLVTPGLFSLFFFWTFYFVWGIAHWQCCDSFSWTEKGLNCTYTCIHSPSNSLPIQAWLPYNVHHNMINM